ncbi:MAG: hypothetical protein HY815_21895 [Candidatus Riflebacteria bacterium]|nr:hypothetical protein [Candidatus Riflebacteria bacterium]
MEPTARSLNALFALVCLCLHCWVGASGAPGQELSILGVDAAAAAPSDPGAAGSVDARGPAAMPSPEAEAPRPGTGVAAPFLVIGHRGSPRTHPENTIPSFEEAMRQGANALEIDVCYTQDDRIVLWHDPDHSNVVATARELGLEPGMRYRPYVPDLWSPLRRPVHEMDLATFRANHKYIRIDADPLDPASLFSGLSSFASSPVDFLVDLFTSTLAAPAPAPSDVPIPTFYEFCEWAAKVPKLGRVFVDVKVPAHLVGRFSRTAAWVLKQWNLGDRIIFMSTSREAVETMKATLGETGAAFAHDQVVTGVVPSAAEFSAVDAAERAGCSYAPIGKPVLCVKPWSTYREVIAADLKKRGSRRLVAWTINDPGELRALVEMGVDGIMTDTPGVLCRIAAEMGKAAAASQVD